MSNFPSSSGQHMRHVPGPHFPEILLSLLLFGISACGGPLVGVTVVDERTALENQVLGTYQELNQEVMLVASVRYIDPS